MLQSNSLSGTLPSELGRLTALEYLCEGSSTEVCTTDRHTIIAEMLPLIAFEALCPQRWVNCRH